MNMNLKLLNTATYEISPTFFGLASLVAKKIRVEGEYECKVSESRAPKSSLLLSLTARADHHQGRLFCTPPSPVSNVEEEE